MKQNDGGRLAGNKHQHTLERRRVSWMTETKLFIAERKPGQKHWNTLLTADNCFKQSKIFDEIDRVGMHFINQTKLCTEQHSFTPLLRRFSNSGLGSFFQNAFVIMGHDLDKMADLMVPIVQ
jgi:hypothetical protein